MQKLNPILDSAYNRGIAARPPVDIESRIGPPWLPRAATYLGFPKVPGNTMACIRRAGSRHGLRTELRGYRQL